MRTHNDSTLSMSHQPALDMDSIAAAVCRADKTADVVVARHGSIFDASSDAPLHEELVKAAQERGNEARASLERLRKNRALIPDRLEVLGDGTPWTLWDLACAIVFGVLSVVFLLVAINTIATTLLANALIDNRVQAYLFAATPLAVALVLKCLASVFNVEAEKRRYIAVVQVTGILLGLSWIPVFAHTFPGIGATLAGSLSLNPDALWDGSGAGPGSSNKLLTACQLLAETFLAAGVWLHIQRLVDKHQVTRYEPNPRADTEDDLIEEAVNALDAALDAEGKERAHIEQIKNARDAFCGQAADTFDRLSAEFSFIRRYAGAGRLPELAPRLSTTTNGHTSKD
jgi:hypothetical protein